MTTFGAPKISYRAGKGTRDHSANAIRPIEQLSRNLANPVQLGNRDHFFVRGNLEDAVARRVDDRKTGADVLFAKLFDNFCS